ncbi:hypothetical protein LSTR_LSTR009415 [Laodelphax striatellus]|uniref:RING-type E3 ubiquitin transferase n=1 Tax=Laodelphax striatellus TaxID=195883 RepID=A0A482WNG4_LAOST|nr:hypothetical protein LSTR_LSTR009415 [Laodelphax striatellus]
MFIQVKNVSDNRKEKLEISKCALIQLLKESISKIFDVPVEKQRLFFRGKQLENEYKLFDYGLNINDMILLMVKEDVQAESSPKKEMKDSKNVDAIDYSLVRPNDIQYYKVGDLVEYYIAEYDTWYNGIIQAINIPEDDFHLIEESGFTSNATFNIAELKSKKVFELSSRNFVPYIKLQIPFQYLKVNDEIMINYNIKNPESRGVWYSAVITSLSAGSMKVTLKTVIDGKFVDVNGCNVKNGKDGKFFHALDRFSYPEQSDLEKTMVQYKDFDCSRCKNNPSKKCRQCGCVVCGGKENEDQLILCDECDDSYHLWCVDPPLVAVPEDDWYCQQCRNDENEIVKAGEKLNFSKKRQQMKSVANESTRDWGKGMACVGRTKVCTIVPSNHFGPVPGVEVGTCWKFRIQVSEAGIHRPHVAGISGRANEGAYSIVLSGGYEDDIDSGDTFMYTGSGGRDLSGNKRTAEQSCDQELTRYNLALALNCNAPVDPVNGAEAKDWRKGKPVRVVRNHKVNKHSKYGPQDGNRYDGIYKVVKYYPEKGKSGFIVWRYMLKRDDTAPAPWTKEGKKWIEQHGLNEMICPEGYEEKPEKKTKKRVLEESLPKNTSPIIKKQKTASFELEKSLENLIKSDTKNKNSWKILLTHVSEGKQKFLNEVQTNFECICCQEVVNRPVSTPCGHIFCEDCLSRSFKAEIYTCPTCRHDLTTTFKMAVNLKLQEVLNCLFPGYASGR